MCHCCTPATRHMACVEIKLSRMDRVYLPGQTLKGVATVNTKGSGSLQHEGISLIADGAASLQLSAKSVGLFEAFYSSIKPVQLLSHQQELQPSGKLPDGRHEFEFEFVLQPVTGEKLHESYHGVFVNLQYVITVEVRRGMLAKSLKRSIEFIVEAPDARPHKLSPAPFSIVPESLENVRKSALHQVPQFSIKGQLDSVTCDISRPLTGVVTIQECSATIRSIELQLVRVETCGYQDGLAREATEIQNIQVADGPVCYGWPIPVHMVFPRLFTCPTVSTRTFKVDFEVNLVVLFSDGHLLTENFPLKLVRGSGSPAASIGGTNGGVSAADSRSMAQSARTDSAGVRSASMGDPLSALLAGDSSVDEASQPSRPATLPAEKAKPAVAPVATAGAASQKMLAEDPLGALLAGAEDATALPSPLQQATQGASHGLTSTDVDLLGAVEQGSRSGATTGDPLTGAGHLS